MPPGAGTARGVAKAERGRAATPRDIPALDPRERRIRLRLRDDFEHYAAICLKIAAKDGALVPLRLNRAQRAIHAAIERELAEAGKVRALILKGRQQGASTYVEGANFGGFPFIPVPETAV